MSERMRSPFSLVSEAPDPAVYVSFLGKANNKSSTTTLTSSFAGVAIGADESIFVAFAQQWTSGAVATYADNLGNVYTQQNFVADGGAVQVYLFACVPSVVGTVTSITVTMSVAVASEFAIGMVAARFRHIGSTVVAASDAIVGNAVSDTGILLTAGPVDGIAIGARGQRTTGGLFYNSGTMVDYTETLGGSNASNMMVSLAYASPCTVNGLRATKNDASGNRAYGHVGKSYAAYNPWP